MDDDPQGQPEPDGSRMEPVREGLELTKPAEPNAVHAAIAAVLRRTKPHVARELGLPDPDPVWCDNCRSLAEPEGRGVCPQCKRVLPGSSLAKSDPVNKRRVRQLIAELTVQFQPTTPTDRWNVERLAAYREREEAMKKLGSAEHQRLVQLSQLVVSALEESRLTSSTPTPESDLSLDEMAARVKRIDEMIELVRRSRDVEAGPSTAYVAPAETLAEPNPLPTPEPERECPFGCGTTSKCDELKRLRLDVWRVFHFDDPEEVERRRKEATAVMMRQIGRPHPWDA